MAGFGSFVPSPMTSSPNIGQQGMNLLQMALKQRSGLPQAGGATGATPNPGLLAQLFDPENPGGKNGLLQQFRNAMAPKAGAPTDLTPPGGPSPTPDLTDPTTFVGPTDGAAAASLPGGLW